MRANRPWSRRGDGTRSARRPPGARRPTASHRLIRIRPGRSEACRAARCPRPKARSSLRRSRHVRVPPTIRREAAVRLSHTDAGLGRRRRDRRRSDRPSALLAVVVGHGVHDHLGDRPSRAELVLFERMRQQARRAGNDGHAAHCRDRKLDLAQQRADCAGCVERNVPAALLLDLSLQRSDQLDVASGHACLLCDFEQTDGAGIVGEVIGMAKSREATLGLLVFRDGLHGPAFRRQPAGDPLFEKGSAAGDGAHELVADRQQAGRHRHLNVGRDGVSDKPRYQRARRYAVIH